MVSIYTYIIPNQWSTRVQKLVLYDTPYYVHTGDTYLIGDQQWYNSYLLRCDPLLTDHGVCVKFCKGKVPVTLG